MFNYDSMNSENNSEYIIFFDEIHLTDITKVGGKNASLGELYHMVSQKEIHIPFGFAINSNAYWHFLDENHLKQPLIEALKKLDTEHFTNLKEVGLEIRNLIGQGKIPKDLSDAIIQGYQKLCNLYGPMTDVAARSSATAEDLPSASFAGQHESFLNIRGEKSVMTFVQKCYASLFTDRAIKYREDNGFKHMNIALSVGIQKMVRADKASSGIIFTIEPETGFKDIVHISGCWGLGENIVQGSITPDEFYVFKPTIKAGKNGIISKKLGSKEKTMIYAQDGDMMGAKNICNIETPLEKQEQYVLNDQEINKLASCAILIEEHYGLPMDIEWAKDGNSGELFIVQARPETTHQKDKRYNYKEYSIQEKGKILVKGNAVGRKITSGIARILHSPEESHKLKEGEILVTEMTNPDWDPILKRVKGIITNTGGRTSHASIVARELGVAAVVGAENATQIITDGQAITLSCAEGDLGVVYDGLLKYEEKTMDFRKLNMPETQAMMILGDPDRAFALSYYPNNGIGLMRMEFIINNSIQVHPMALVNFDTLKDLKAKEEIEKLCHHYPHKKNYFIDKLAQSIATIGAAFYPKDVIVRMSDFKTNEYANLLGGNEFEPKEENPMLGFRGASRYYHERYKDGFKLECEAIKKVRDEMGLTNIKLMIPFCRTVEEGKKVIALMAENGLIQKTNKLEIYMMVEVPSNVILAEDFAKIFDGFSIGSNDLTQLTLGIDRDSSLISNIFNEQNPAVTKLIEEVIAVAKDNDIKIGLCGQAPSDYPEFAKFLVEKHIDSISFNPDALIKGIENINRAEENMRRKELFVSGH